MKTIATILFASAIFVSFNALASDKWTEERIKAKTGRYSPAEEARHTAFAHDDGQCAQHNCCGCGHQAPAHRTTWKDALLSAKLGRSSAISDSRVQPARLRDQGRTHRAAAEPALPVDSAVMSPRSTCCD